MNNLKRYVLYLIILLLLIPSASLGQTLPEGTPVLKQFYRQQQLLGKLNTDVGFTSLPLFPVEAFHVQNAFDPDSSLSDNRFFGFDGLVNQTIFNVKGKVQLMPIVWKNQFNSLHPYGFNDGVMVPSRGYQTVFSVGIYAQLGPLTIQLNPEWLDVANTSFEDFYKIYNKKYSLGGIDLPEHFGDTSFQKGYWGQSSIRLSFGPVSLGYSNENLWWGPGVHNALLMTNNAPGFPHFTINTVCPVKTPIGSFEGQLIGGKLIGSGYTSGLLDDWRYLNALTMTYQPKWIPGLFLGFVRSFQIYERDMTHKLFDYLPVFGSVVKVAVGNEETDDRRQCSYLL